VTSIYKLVSAVTNVGRNNNGPKVANFLVVSNDLHEGWNDSIAVLRCYAGEILGSVKIPSLSYGTKRPCEPL